MSYILDALKKIEQKREQQEPKTLLSGWGIPEGEPKKRLLWPYVVIVALLLNAGIMIWWIGFPRSDKKESLARPAAGQPTGIPTPTSPRHNPQDQLTAINKRLPAINLPQTPNRLSKKPVDRVAVQKVEKQHAPEPVKKRPPDPVKTESPAPPNKEAPRSDKVFNVNELPAAIKNALPPLKVSAHAYDSDPKNRMTRINDQILKEGQEMSEGLKVDQIFPGGLILLYKGYRFRIGIKE
jgi:general secretion pathway protein B